MMDEDLRTESFERASADLEILQAAYPDEIDCHYHQQSGAKKNDDDEKEQQQQPASFPLIFTLKLTTHQHNNDQNDNTDRNNQQSKYHATITMEFPEGYPLSKPLEILSYRSSNATKKEIIEEVVSSVKTTALEALNVYDGEECGLSCCAIAMETWNDLIEKEKHAEKIRQERQEEQSLQKAHFDQSCDDDIHWITSEDTLLDRKSTFQAHLCVVSSEDMVKRAVDKLILGNTKLQRATHNMFAYRFTETLENGKTILKHDNDDDGEDAAGSRLAQLLEMRKEDGVLIMVSRWYGGIHLGPKRFAHITNVARNLLVECHENGTLLK